MTRFRADTSWRRPLQGNTVIAGSPIKLFTLTEKGREVAERIENREAIDSSTLGLAHRFLDAGAVVPVLEPTGPEALALITVVIPVFAKEKRDVDQLSLLITNIAMCHEVIIIDDHSPYPVLDAISLPNNCRVIRNEWNMGPAGARNSGLAAVQSDYVAFVDADTHVNHLDLMLLASHLQDASVVAVAPRIVGTKGGDSMTERYEESNSPLDLGARPARVRAGTRVSYVPTACLVARTSSIREEGGFDPELATGEDVDLVWRLDSPLHWVIYESAVEIEHDARTSIWSWIDQRRGYGRSAASLAKRHDGALAPVVANSWSIAIAAVLFSKRRAFAIPLVIHTAISLARRLPNLPNRWFEASRLALLGHWHAWVSIARATIRVWLPIALVVASVSKTARRILLASATVPALVEWVRKRPRLDPLRYVGLRVLDDAAYAIGVWEGCVAEKNAAPLIPRITKP
jgi:mycofactocin glycosyltransferase